MQSAWLLSLLVITLIVTGGLTWLGQRTAADHRAAVSRALRDNAAFAADRYTSMVVSTAQSLLKGIFPDRYSDINQVQFPALDFSKVPVLCECKPVDNIRLRFAYDYTRDKLVLSDGTLTTGERTQLVDILKNNSLAGFRAGQYRSLWLGKNSPRDLIVAFVVEADEPEPLPGEAPAPLVRRLALGLLADRGFEQALLPTLKLIHAGMPKADSANNPRFALSVSAQGTVLRQEGHASAYSYEGPLGPGFDDVKVTMYIDRDAVKPMSGMGSGSTGERYAQLFGLMALASILIVASLILARRQSALAMDQESFASSVSHELRTPLAQIRMFTETLLLGRVRNEVERRRSLEIIDQEAKRLTALVENVLQVTRADRGTLRVAPAATQLAPVVREIVDRFSQLPRSRTADFRLEVEERLVAVVDPSALRQMLDNLLDNALKYGPAGQRIGVGLAMFEEHARLWVDDEGPGVPAKERERVFETFYRSTAHRESSIAGSGIGLAVVREFAGLLNGRAWIEDAPGGGARVVVEFPDAYLRAEEATGSWAVA